MVIIGERSWIIQVISDEVPCPRKFWRVEYLPYYRREYAKEIYKSVIHYILMLWIIFYLTEGKKVRIIIDVSASSSNYNKAPSPGGNQKEDQYPKQFIVGRVVISPGMMWPDFDNAVATVLTNHSRVSRTAGRIVLTILVFNPYYSN